VTPDGRTYFVDHNTRTTTWSDPRTGAAAAPAPRPAVPASRPAVYAIYRSARARAALAILLLLICV
jgi:hypothetical protein